MFVPATLEQYALALTPIELSAADAPPLTGGEGAVFDVRSAMLNVLDGHPAIVAGTLDGVHASQALADRVVTLQTLGRHGWSGVASATTGAGGGFRLRYVPSQTGSRRVRLRFAGDNEDPGARRSLGAINVYRLAGASWYGGGGGLACGGSLTSSTLGVANKTLPCGTLVTLRYGDRTVRVPVVDRGPYVAGREFDLTEATKQALGFGSTGDVWSTR